jgi:hypothetical protein
LGVFGCRDSLASFLRERSLPKLQIVEQAIFSELLPRFDDIESRATQAQERFWELAGEVGLAESYEGDLASDAFSHGWDTFDSLSGMRQMLLNLFAVCLFHALEQKLALACNAHQHPIKDRIPAALRAIADWFKAHRGLDIRKLREYAAVEQLQLLANTVKHGAGRSSSKLLKLRPEIFESYSECSPDKIDLREPLAGEDLCVAPADLKAFCGAASAFVEAIASGLEKAADSM